MRTNVSVCGLVQFIVMAVTCGRQDNDDFCGKAEFYCKVCAEKRQSYFAGLAGGVYTLGCGVAKVQCASNIS